MAALKRIRRTKKNVLAENGICFVIMPFGEWFDNYYNEIYFPAILNSGFDPRRADDMYRPSSIIQDIWELTKKSKLILADLTNKNANVFYELGLAHALAKPVILITSNIDDVPFDLRGLRIIVYNKNETNWGKTLKKNVEKALKETLESPNETIPTSFLEVKKSYLPTPKITKHDKELLEVKQNVEQIKKHLSVEARNYDHIYPISTIGAVKNYAHQMLISGASPLSVTMTLVKDFNFTKQVASTIVTQVLNESNDPTEIKE